MLEILNTLNLSVNFGISLGIVKDEIFSNINLFLVAVALLYLVIASIQDLKRREVENWWSFSFLVFVLVYRLFVSIFNGNYMYFCWGLIGLAAGFAISLLFYYSRLFAGGDAKLLMAFFCVLPLSLSWKANAELLVLFILLMFFVGGIYGIFYSFIIMVMNFKDFRKSFVKFFLEYKRILFFAFVVALMFFLFLAFFEREIAFILFFVVLLGEILIVFAKAVEESCLNIFVNVKELTIGDWLVKSVRVGKNKIVKPNWEGLSEEELNLIRKNYKKKVLVKYGLPFVPVFLLAFLALLVILYCNII